ncbi:uncharacterized protein LOC121524903 [Cheilinus undulatus]|uniref:uncharacterized protein LOC121524903 n=1 Tax=Cheilinus undulatus TaxID=241271 RepID=UPI001BD20122|nr:uncharacterized protein LOC121524903 [Cheilinus undulatus]
MASELTQDAVLQFLRSGGGSVKNSDLLLHFRRFIRDHEDRDRNREMFKKFVNSVATVQQLDGVSYVVLKRKFKGRSPGGGERGRREPSPGNARVSPEKPRKKPQPMEMTTTAPPGGTASETILPAAGIMQNNNNVETNFNIKQQDETSRPGYYGGPAPGQTARLLQPLPPDQRSKIGYSKVGFDPIAPVITPVVSAVRPHGETRQQIPIQEPLRGREAERKATSFPELPAQDWSTKIGQHEAGFTPLDPGITPVVSAVRPHGETRQQIPIQERHRGRDAERQILSFSEPPVQDWSRKVGQHEAGFTPIAPGITPVVPAVRSHSETRQQIPSQEPLRGREAELKTPSFLESPALDRSPKMGQNRFSFDPVASGITPAVHAVRSHEEIRQQIPIQEPIRGREAELKTPSFPEPPALDRSPKMGQNRFSFDPVASGITPTVHPVRSHEEIRQQIPIQEPIRGREAELKTTSFPKRPTQDRTSKTGHSKFGFSSLFSGITSVVSKVRTHGETKQQEPLRGREAELKTPTFPESPALDRSPKIGRFSFDPLASGITPVISEVRRHEEIRQQIAIKEPLRGREHDLKEIPRQDVELHPPSFSDPPARDQSPKVGHKVGFAPVAPEIITMDTEVRAYGETVPTPETQVSVNAPRRRHRHRKSYKSAVSYDEDEDEEEEEMVPVRRGSSGGEWPLSVPLGDMGKALSASSPCIIDVPSISTSPAEKLPKIYVQGVKEEAPPPREGQHSFPLEAEHYIPSTKMMLHHDDVHADRRFSQPAGFQQRGSLSSSTSNIYSPSSDSGLSMRDWPMSGSPRGLGWNSSLEDLHTRAGNSGSDLQIQEALRRAQKNKVESSTGLHTGSKLQAPWHHSTGHLHEDQEPKAYLSPFCHSTDRLHENQQSAGRVKLKHLSTGDLYDDHQEAELSEESTSSSPSRQHSAIPRRLGSHLRSRMCRSMAADIDQLLQEEEERGGGGDNEAARLNRLHLISSTLSLPYNVSTSSLSSCSTPPLSHSFANLTEGGEGRGGKKSIPNTSSSAPPEGSGRQSQVPLESREHDWLVKGAAGAWPDIYSLFREDSTLLNRRDFITGFTVLHWIAKHGDHRVLNTLWYGVQKAGLSFDINARSTCGHTPLHIAAMHGHKNIMRLLVNKFHADVRLRDTAGKKPWHYLSHFSPPDVFQLLGAPARAALGGGGSSGGGGGGGGVVRSESMWKHEKRRRRHHLSSASSAERPQSISAKVKRSSSIAAFLKHKSLRHLQGHQSDSPI